MTVQSERKRGTGLPKPVMVVETGEVFPSRAKVAETLGCGSPLISKAIKYGTPVGGLHLTDACKEKNDEPVAGHEGRLLSDPIKANRTTDGTAASDEPHNEMEKEKPSLPTNQLEVKDRQISGLQDCVTSLLEQLREKDAQISRLTGELSDLNEHIKCLDASREYWQTAMKHCEEAANAKVATVVNQYREDSTSRFGGIRRRLFAGDAS